MVHLLRSPSKLISATLYAAELRRREQHLRGRKLTVVTGHSSIARMFVKLDLKREFSSWMIQLQDYNYDVNERAEALNQLADALSPEQCEQSEPLAKEGSMSFSQRDVSNSQRYDSDLAAIITSLDDT
ncbi:hypothetical protein MRX96_038434 [Rhipicephalus microplus]